MAQVTKQEWITAGLNQLREFGPQSVSGEKLARRLDVTRGSFYHHFNSMDDYIQQVMDEWERAYTFELLEKSHALEPRKEMEALLEAAWNADISLEIAVRQWGFTNVIVRERLERMDGIRLAYISKLYGILVNDTDKGQLLGKIAYYGLLGAMHASPQPNKKTLRELVLEIQNVLIKEL